MPYPASTMFRTTLPPNFGHFPYAANTGETADGVTNVYNLGARVKGKAADLDYTLEVNKQFGEFADEDDIDALGYAAVVGYTIPAANNLRISAEYVHADGDSNPTDGDHETFYQFTPAPHPHLGAQVGMGGRSELVEGLVVAIGRIAVAVRMDILGRYPEVIGCRYCVPDNCGVAEGVYVVLIGELAELLVDLQGVVKVGGLTLYPGAEVIHICDTVSSLTGICGIREVAEVRRKRRPEHG